MKRMSYYLSAALVVAAGACASFATAEYYRSGSQPRAAKAQTEESTALPQKGHLFRNIEPGGPVELFDVSGSALEQQRANSLLTRSFDNPVGTFYMVAPTYQGAPGVSQGFYGKIDPLSGVVDMIYRGRQYCISEMDYNYQSGAVRNGILYIPAFQQDMVSGETHVSWRRVDITSGEVLPQINWGDGLNDLHMLFAMTYDSQRDCFFGLSINVGSGAVNGLVRINCNNTEDFTKWDFQKDSFGFVETIDLGGVEGNYMSSVCFNPADGLIYCLKGSEGALYTFNPESRQVVRVATFDPMIDRYCFPGRFYAAPMVYSPRDKAFFGTFMDNVQEKVVLYSIDAVSYETMDVANLNPICYPASLLCYDSYAEGAAPDWVTNLKMDIAHPALQGNVTFTMPSTNFDGVRYDSGKQLTAVIEIDGTQIHSGSYAAGQSVSVSANFAEGEHVARVVVKDGNLEGAELTTRFYAGNDAPIAPTGLMLDDDMTLLWDAPSTVNGGMHGGYVNPDAITYNVYNGDTRLNTEPITGLTFRVPAPATLTRYNITVRAVNGGNESEDSRAISRPVGPGLSLPQTYVPLKQYVDLFDSRDLDNNGNGRYNEFVYSTFGNYESMRLEAETPYIQPNDELYMPKMRFDDTEHQYLLSYSYQNTYDRANPARLQNVEVILRPGFLPSDKDQVIFKATAADYSDLTAMNFRFAVPAAGDYYIVFRETGDNGKTLKYRGARYSNMKVEKLEATTEAPGELTNVKIKAADYGDLKAVISFTAPTTDMIGNPLPAGSALTVKAESGSHSNTVTTTVGATGTIEVETDGDGMQSIVLYAINEHGEGVPTTYSSYIGLDVPTTPLNLRHTISDDNMTMHIEWDAPTEGVNGGFVDPSGLSYNIYSGTGTSSRKIGTTTNTYYDYTTVSKGQAAYSIGPSAVNRVGESMGNVLAYDFLGTPHQLPMTEVFGYTGFSLTKWAFSIDQQFSNVAWDSGANFNGLGIGDPVFDSGCLYAYSDAAGSQMGQLLAPKFSTKNVKRAKVVVKYWDYANATAMEFWGRSSKNQTLRKIGTTCAPKRSGYEWGYYEVELPEDMLDCGWVQVNLRTFHGNTSQRCIIDSYSVVQNIENDFKISSVAGPVSNTIGDRAEFKVTAVNSGLESGRTTIYAELVGDGKVLESRRINTGNIQSLGSQEFTARFMLTSDHLKYENICVRGRVETEGDENPDNDVMELPITIYSHVLPVVTDLEGEWASDEEKSVNLSWTTPDTSYGPREGFEAVPAFGLHTQLGQWKNIDLDGGSPFALQDPLTGSALEWDGYDQPGSWQMIDADALGLSSSDNFYPHSGKSFIVARSIAFSQDETPKPSSDWLISPEVKGGTKVSFWFNTVHADYTETVTVFYSEGSGTIPTEGGMENFISLGNGQYQCGDFKSLRHFSRGGEIGWEQVEFTLPANAKYFALVYRSIGNFGAMIDDIEFTPANLLHWEIDSYSLYEVDANGNKRTVQKNIKGNSVSYDLTDASKSLGLTVICHDEDGNSFESPISNLVMLERSGVEGVFDGNAFVAGGKGFIIANGLAGKTAAVYSTDGKLLKKVAVADDQQIIPMDAGVYMVKVDGQAVKVLVK